jgi:CxxC motif-containing protein
MSGSATNTVEMICIACPIACRLTVMQSGPEVSVSGNRCARGDDYGREEFHAPKRIVTAVVPTDSMGFPCAPVRTDTPVARDRVRELLRTLYATRVSLPVHMGEVMIDDFDGARVIFTRTLPPDEVAPVGEPGTETKSKDQVT